MEKTGYYADQLNYLIDKDIPREYYIKFVSIVDDELSDFRIMAYQIFDDEEKHMGVNKSVRNMPFNSIDKYEIYF
jgi:hypothetical protein